MTYPLLFRSQAKYGYRSGHPHPLTARHQDQKIPVTDQSGLGRLTVLARHLARALLTPLSLPFRSRREGHLQHEKIPIIEFAAPSHALSSFSVLTPPTCSEMESRPRYLDSVRE